jgi:cyclopropane fatty-acyl-phospholipid synthase-like methyltransferase
MIELAKMHNDKYEMKVLHVADICTVECDAKFDGAVAMYSLIHLTKEQTILAINNLCKYLKPSAKIAITVYNGDRNGYSDEALHPELELKQFYRDYTCDELTVLFKSMGFKIEEVQLWDDEDDITASNEDVEFGVIGLIATWQGEKV